MVMQYIKDGNLRQYLQVNYKRLDFKDRLDQLHNIARGLKSIHSKGLVHRDFHAGNILNEDAYCSITDLGLCKPANETSESEIYGVLPYVAPEVLNGKQYTSATDIYSFAMIMYEIFTGLPPYHDIAHEEALAVWICQGVRPKFKIKIPQLLEDLIKRCWDADPTQRPTAEELKKILGDWWDEIYRKKSTEFYQQYEKVTEFNKNLPKVISDSNYQIHPSAVYTSRLLNFKNLPEPQNSQEVNDKFYSLPLSTDSLDSLEIKFRDIFTNPNNSDLTNELDIDFGTTTNNNSFTKEIKDLTDSTKRQLSLNTQINTTQEKNKLSKISKEEGFSQPQEYYSEPIEISCSFASNLVINNIDYWTNIHPNFTPELVQEWINHGFTAEQVSDWIRINSLAEQYQAISRAAFCAWLRDIKKLTPEEVLNHHNLESLKTEFAQTQQTTQTVQPTNWPNN